MTKFQINTDNLDVVGDMASEVGRATMTMAPPGGKSETTEVKYLVVWKRLSGRWLLHRDIYNAIA
jgi:ketosteroid isomerase-like protein